LQNFSQLRTLLIFNSRIPVKSIHRIAKVLVEQTPDIEVRLSYVSMDNWIKAFQIKHKLLPHSIKVLCTFDDRALSPTDHDLDQSQPEQPKDDNKAHPNNCNDESQHEHDSNSLCETEPGDYSLGTKRPYHDYWDTPSDVNKRTREFKISEKIRSIDFGTCTVNLYTICSEAKICLQELLA
jgi:hypothetical protein